MVKTIAAALFVGLLASPGLAQTFAPGSIPASAPGVSSASALGSSSAPAPTPGSGTWNGLPDRFQVDVGLFNAAGKTVLKATIGSGASDEVNFENDLGLPGSARTFWVYASMRPLKHRQRHQLGVNYTSIQRSSGTKVLARSFTWNGQVYDAGLSATGSMGTNIVSAYYRFSVVKKDRFEIGPTAGLGFLKLSADIKAQGIVTPPGGVPITRTLDESKSGGYPTGDIGGFVNIWVNKRTVIRGDFLYIYIAPGEIVASVSDGRLGVDYYPWRHAGIGLQYKYNRFRYDQGIRSSTLGGSITYQGLQVYGSFLF